MTFIIQPLDEASAKAMFDWRYEPPFDLYSFSVGDLDEDVRFFTNPQNNYFAMRDKIGDLVGFCCFGMDARVPGGDYGLDACDIGMGIRPDLTGRGMGGEFAKAAINHALQVFQPKVCRVTIAAFNLRARRVWEKLGFQIVLTFLKPNGMEFVIMTADSDQLTE
jgi:[ribosomal protein S18]-alanine N-acetyltransferase